MSTTTSREQIMGTMKYHDETPDNIHSVYHQSHDYTLDSQPVTRHTSLDTVPNIDEPFNPGYGTQEGDNIVVYTANYLYIKHVYDGSEYFIGLPRTTMQAAKDFIKYVPVVGS